MASENSAQEKTEDPTPKRMEKAFEDGQVLSSKELFVFFNSFYWAHFIFLIHWIRRPDSWRMGRLF